MDVDASITSALSMSMADNVEFSDEDGDDNPVRLVSSEKTDDKNFINYGFPSDRPQITASALGRVVDREADSRSLAPEPSAAPRLLRRRWTKETFDVTTPESLEQTMQRKQAGQRKPRVQSGAKILHKELRELGLEEWIDRDKKNNPEYRKVVTEARKRHREKVRLETLARCGVTAEGVEPPAPSPGELRQPNVDPLDHLFHAATKVVLESSGGYLGGSDSVEPSASGALQQTALSEIPNQPSQDRAGRVNRRKQKLDEIQRRDQLAKEAMDMMD
jgi:hypothetical protein